MREKRGYNMNIKEVEKVTGLTKANIRFYEEEGLVCPKRNEQNNYRIYTEVDLYRGRDKTFTGSKKIKTAWNFHSGDPEDLCGRIIIAKSNGKTFERD